MKSINKLFVLTAICATFGSSLVQADKITRTGWDMNYGKGVIETNKILKGYGTKDNYEHANIPSESDKGWISAPDTKIINFGSKKASKIGAGLCKKAVDYTYFQTFVTVPVGGKVTEFKINFDGMDDGSRISIFNKTYPDGKIVEGSYVQLNKKGTSDLKDLIVDGINRVVITQVDDCPTGNQLKSAQVVLNGSVVPTVVAPQLPEMVKLLAYSINNEVRGDNTSPDYHVAIDNGVGKILKGIDIGTLFEVVKIQGESIALRIAKGVNKGKFLKGEDNKATLSDSKTDNAIEFIVRNPLENTAGNFVSFESVAFPGQYLRHQGYRLKLDKADVKSATLLRRDATFRFQKQ